MSIPGVDVRVEIAFTSGYRTPAVDRVWTDVSEWVELVDGLSITYGRADEVGTADANQLQLVLDNSDGRFTWGRAASPYYPNVKIGRPVRVVAVVGGVDHVRYTGYVEGWPLEWSGGGDNYAVAAIDATSRLARLGIDSPLTTTVDQSTTTTNPAYYWPLTEAAGASQGAEYRSPSPAMRASGRFYAFGVGDLGDARPGVRISGWRTGEPGGRLEADVPELTLGGTGTAAFTVSLFVQTLNPEELVLPTSKPLVVVGYTDGTEGPVIETGTPWPTHLAENDGLVHHLACSYSQSGGTATQSWYYDGILASTTTGPVPGGAAKQLNKVAVVWPTTLFGDRDYLVGRVGWWQRAVDASEVETIAVAGADAFEGDTTDERLARYAAWARIPAAEVVTSPSPITLAAVQTEETQIVDLMREVETTEAGVLHDDRDGNLVLRNRDARYDTVPAIVLDVAAELVGLDYSPRVDRQGLVNVGRGTNTLGTVAATYANEESREEYGDASYEVETSALDPDEPLYLAAAAVNANAEPRPRAPSVTLNMLDLITYGTAPDAVGLDIGSKVRIASAPGQATSTDADYFVEGYAEQFSEADWSITLNLSPAWPVDSVFILDDPDRGELDAGNLIAL